MNKYWYRHRCYVCGRFCRWDADNSTPFGSYCDYEPPEPNYFCDACIEKEKQYHIEAGWLPANWVPADWEFEVAEKLGYWRAGPRLAGWGGWHRLDRPLPEGYVWQELVGKPMPKAVLELIDD